jgi:hypothetical protein
LFASCSLAITCSFCDGDVVAGRTGRDPRNLKDLLELITAIRLTRDAAIRLMG